MPNRWHSRGKRMVAPTVDIGQAGSGVAAEGPYTKAAAVFAGLAIIVTYLVAAGASHWWPFNIDVRQSHNSGQTICVGPVIASYADSPGRLRPPKNLSITWDRSPTVFGRVSAAIHWQNVDPRTAFGLIEVTGRYGRRAAEDIPHVLDGRELPAEGLCGHWLRRYNRYDDGERGVFFDGLWAGEPYCFSVNSSDPGGGMRSPYPSVGTTPVCENAPWNNDWGQAEGH